MDLLFLHFISNPSVSGNVNNIMVINDIVKSCSVKTTISSFKDMFMNKLPFPANVFENVNNPISGINIICVDGIERSSSYILQVIAKCSTIPHENIPLLNFWMLEFFIMNKHTHLFGISHPKYECYLNCVVDLFFPILRTLNINFQFNSTPDGSPWKCIFETAYSASNSNYENLDDLKFRLAKYDTFYNGKI